MCAQEIWCIQETLVLPGVSNTAVQSTHSITSDLFPICTKARIHMKLWGFTFSKHSETFWKIKINIKIPLLYRCSDKGESEPCSSAVCILREITLGDKTLLTHTEDNHHKFNPPSPHLSPGAVNYNLSPHMAHDQYSAAKCRASFMLEFSKHQVPVNSHSLLFSGSPLSSACRTCQTNAGKVRG